MSSIQSRLSSLASLLADPIAVSQLPDGGARLRAKQTELLTELNASTVPSPLVPLSTASLPPIVSTGFNATRGLPEVGKGKEQETDKEEKGSVEKEKEKNEDGVNVSAPQLYSEVQSLMNYLAVKQNAILQAMAAVQGKENEGQLRMMQEAIEKV